MQRKTPCSRCSLLYASGLPFPHCVPRPVPHQSSRCSDSFPPGGGSPGLWPGEGTAAVQSPRCPRTAPREARPYPTGGRCPPGADEGRLRVTLLCNAKCCACGAGVLWAIRFAVSPMAFAVLSLISLDLRSRQRSTCGAQNLLRAFACLQILTAALPAAFLPLPPAAEGHRPPGGGSPRRSRGGGAVEIQSPRCHSHAPARSAAFPKGGG